jgi:hypothetical protein
MTIRILPRPAALRHELRVLGPWLFALPLLAAAGLGALFGVLDLRSVHRDFLAQMAVASLEACLPLAAGVTVATASARDPAVELQLALPTPYRFTALRRCALLLGWALLLEAASVMGYLVAAPWALAGGRADYVVFWLAPTVWLAGAGALLALLLRSQASASAVLGGIWVAQLIFHGYFMLNGWTRPWFLFATLFAPDAGVWWANRVELILTALALFLGVWVYLRNTEWRLRGEDG